MKKSQLLNIIREEAKVLDENSFELYDTEVDPTTGSSMSKVRYLPDFKKTYDDLDDAKDSISKLSGRKEMFNDKQMKLIRDLVKDAFNKYRTHLRNNYRKEYDKIRGNMEEMSTSSNAGAYNTPYAFNKNKKADGTDEDVYISQLGYKPVKK